MNYLQVFNSSQFGTVRVIDQNGEPWFVAKDVCAALDIGNSRQAITRLDEDEKGVILTDTLGGIQELSVVNEPGLYTLILGSRKPEAKAFKRWITHEVLPEIRRTGRYGPTAQPLREMRQLLQDAATRLEALEQQLPGYIPDYRQPLPDRPLRGVDLARHDIGAHFDLAAFGEDLRLYLFTNKETVESFAESVNVDKRSVFRWLSGVHKPKPTYIDLVLNRIGKTVSDYMI